MIAKEAEKDDFTIEQEIYEYDDFFGNDLYDLYLDKMKIDNLPDVSNPVNELSSRPSDKRRLCGRMRKREHRKKEFRQIKRIAGFYNLDEMVLWRVLKTEIYDPDNYDPVHHPEKVRFRRAKGCVPSSHVNEKHFCNRTIRRRPYDAMKLKGRGCYKGFGRVIFPDNN